MAAPESTAVCSLGDPIEYVDYGPPDGVYPLYHDHGCDCSHPSYSTYVGDGVPEQEK